MIINTITDYSGRFPSYKVEMQTTTKEESELLSAVIKLFLSRAIDESKRKTAVQETLEAVKASYAKLSQPVGPPHPVEIPVYLSKINVTAIENNSGTWDNSSDARQDIKRSLHEGYERLCRESLYEARNVILTVTRKQWRQMSDTTELQIYFKGGTMNPPGNVGMVIPPPEMLYGFHLQVTNEEAGWPILAFTAPDGRRYAVRFFHAFSDE